MEARELQDDGPATRLLASYRPPAGASDELLDPQGRIRPVWRPFVDHLARLGPDELTRRFARGDQYLRDAGVFYRQYGTEGPSERAWPLAHIPVLIEEEEAASIARGLVQRADLLEAVVADIYGPNRLVAEGHLPARLIAGSREWLRPLVGVTPRRGHYLHFIAFEIGRGPDGTWWVLGDRTQAPSGAGFALENRVATSPRLLRPLRRDPRPPPRRLLPHLPRRAAGPLGRARRPRRRSSPPARSTTPTTSTPTSPATSASCCSKART